MGWELIFKIFSYIIIGFAILLVFFIYFSLFFSDILIKWRASKIKESKKEKIKIILQDLSLFIQISMGLGIALLLFSLSRTGIETLAFFVFGLIGLSTSFFLLFWKYLPLRNKMYGKYN